MLRIPIEMKNLKMNAILSGRHVRLTLAKTLEPLGINKRDEL